MNRGYEDEANMRREKELEEMGKAAKAYYDKNFAKEMVIDRINEILSR